MKKKGLYWHVHHNILIEWCYDYDERVEFIKEYKRPCEVPERLKRLKKVKGKLPPVIKMLAKMAAKSYQSACRAGSNAHWDDCIHIKGILQHAIWVYRDELEELHAKECPDCSWNDDRMVFENCNTVVEEK